MPDLPHENPSRNSVPEYDPVAGAKLLSVYQMPDERRKTRIKRPASHTTLDGALFIARGGDGLQEGVYEVESSWPVPR